MDAKDFFNQHVIFRFEELLSAVDPQGSVSSRNRVRTLLHRYCKSGRLQHVRRGLYVVVSQQKYLQRPISPYLIAGKATDDAVLAYHSALESHNIAYTDFNEQTYLTQRRTNDFDFHGQHYRAVYHKFSELNQDRQQTEVIIMMGVQIYRTTLARTIVDVLDRPNISGGWEEVIRSLDRVTHFDVASSVDYALSLKRASIAAKLGYFLDGRLDYFAKDASLVARLLPHAPKQPYYIQRHARGRQVFIKKWQIIVPHYLHERQWEEPDELDH